MRIVYVGKFGKSFATENYVTETLREEGQEVFPFEVGGRRGSRRTSRNQLEDLKTFIEDSKPDFLLFAKAGPPEAERLFDYLRRAGIPSVTWQWDLYWGYRSDRPYHFRACDLFFSTDGAHHETILQDGYNHEVLRQGVYRKENIMYRRNYYANDVAFVGTLGNRAHPERQLMIRELRNKYGHRFATVSRLRGLHLNRFLSRTKVVVGDSYPASGYWSNRVYEIPGRGGFLVQVHTPGLEKEFDNGKHMVFWNRGDYEGMIDQVDYYLENEKEREMIRENGFRHVGRHLTYNHRVRVLLERVTQFLDTRPVNLAPGREGEEGAPA